MPPFRRRRLLLALGSALLVPAAARAEVEADLPQSDRVGIRAVIEAQMQAFRRGDDDAAFGCASPMIQGMFATPDRFMAMVRGLYAPVHRPRSVEFGTVVEIDGRLVQKVELVGPDGAPALALYTMIRGPDGWRIDGVALTESEKPAV